ncbi:MAG: DUF7507 domain-containing protein [Christensenellales bacterium]
MIRKVRRITALVLAVVMLLSVAPLSVLADEHSQYSPSWSAKGNYVHTRRYEFYVGESLVDTQIVKNGDSLLAPATPNAPGGTKFTGWFVGNEQVVFNTVFNDVTSTKTVIANAVFADVCYVYFVYDSTDDGENNGDIIATKEVKPGDKTDANNVPLVVNTPGKVFAHWSDSIDGAAFDFDNETIDEDTNLYAVLNDRWTVTFYEQGGSYTIPKYILNGQPLGDVTPPTRPGYSFREWNTEADGSGTKYTAATLINSSVNLYAIWDAQRVNYTIVYWQENADDSEFTYYETVIVTGGNERPFAGGTITVPSSRIRNDRYTYFSYKEHDTGVIANGDGTSVVNVYYSRNSYTVKFNLNRKNATMTIGGNTYNNGGTLYSFTAKYNADISALWPTASNIPKVGSYYFIGWPSGSGTTYVSKRMNFTSDLFSTSGTRTYDGSWDSDINTYDLHYMIESLDGTGTLYNGVYYKEDMAYNQLANAWGNWSAKQIAGVTNVGKEQDSSMGGDGDYDVYFYYTRNSYDLSFYNYNATVPGHTETLKYGTDISDRSFIPAKPTVLPEGYEFGGWYTTLDTLDDSQFDWTDAEMPAGNLELYAKWSPPVHTVKFFTDEAHSEYDFVVNIAHNGSIGESDLYHDSGDNWQGWYWYVGGVFVPFSFDTKITDDSIVIYPVWETNSYGVEYDVNDGGGTAPVDSNRYKAGSRASVKAPTDQMTAPPNAEVFIGWNTAADGSGVFYYPNSNLTITGNMLLYAQWGPKVAKTSLTYHSNYPEGVPNSNSSKVHTVDDGAGGQRSELWNNERITVWGNKFDVPSDYYFAGWDTSSTGSGSIIAPDSELVVYNGGTNNLYACWKPKVRITIKAASQEWTYDGQEHTNPSVTVTEGTLLSGDTLVATATGSVTNVSDTAEGNNPIAAGYKVMRGETDVTYKYKITAVDGTLEITKRSVTLTSATDSKVYDGNPLTNDTVTVTGDGWATGEGATYDVTGSQTVQGTSNNTFDYTLNSGTVAANYDITKVFGTLTVTSMTDKVTVTITENSGTELYDGEEKTVTGYTVAISNPLYTEADFSFSGTASVSGTNAGTYNMELVPADFTNNNTNFTNVTFVIVDGTLEITKRQVTLTSATASKVYDGTALTNNTVTVGGDGWATGEGATYNVTGSQTNVGSSNNTFTYALNQNTLSDNYDITKTEGTLTVTALDDEVVVTITENSGTELYDGTAKTVTGYTVTSISNTLYTAADFSFSGADSVSGTNAGTYNMELVPADFTNNNTNFTNVTFVIVDGTLEITKRQVTLTSATASKVYDGTALTNNTVTVGGDGWATGEGATYNVTGSQTNVGSSNNTFTYALNQNTLSDNYDITKTEGTLTVTALDDEVVVTITENSGTELYDGTAKTVTGYTVTSISNTLYTAADFSFSGADSVSGTNAGTYNMELVPADFTNNNTNFTNVTFVIVDGTLEITKRQVTLTSATASKVYDGTALTNNTVTVGGDGWATGEGATYNVTGSQTNVGSSNNTFTYALNQNTLSDNYDITKTEGTLTVTALDDEVVVTITENSGTELYDGTAKTVTGYTVTSISNTLYTAADFSFSGADSVSGTNAGTYNMELVPADFTNNNTNFTNVTFVIVDGTLEITKRQVTLTSATASKVYDGTALTNNTVTVGGDGWATGEGATYNVTGSQTNVGSSNNTFTYALNQNTLSDNYDITKTEGTLTVTALDDEVVVTITENSGTELYDGTAKTVTGYTVTSISNTLYTAADFSFSGADSVSGTNAGTYNMELVPADFTNNNTNFTNVTFVIVDGTLEITKRQVTLTSATASKVYDGTALTNNTVTVGGDGWATGEGATYNVTGSQTNVGSSNNTFTYALNQNTLSDNYDITKTEGTLTVTALDDEVVVTITENSGTELYDGTAKTVTGYTVTSISNTLYTAADFSFSGTDSVSGTNAGTYNMELVPADFTNNNTNFTNVTFVIVDGTLEITKRQVTLTSATASKVYDGTALTNNTVTVGGDGWATGEGATYNVTGSQTNVGSSNNTFTYALNQNTLSDNYDITKTEGTLTVTALDDEVVVTITENSGTELYDGTAKTVTGYTVTSISNTLYTAADFSFSGADSVSGTNAGTYNMELVPADFTNNNTNFTNVTFVIVDGTLEITKRQVTLTSATASKVYDGTALTNNTVTVGGDGWATGEGATYNVTGSQTNVGSSNNTFTYALNQNTLSDNYDITKTEGTLTVTALDDEVVVTITENSGTELYDGTAKTVTGYTVTSISNTLYTAADFSFSGADSVSGTNAGTYNMELVPADFTNNNTNFTNVTFVIVDGTLEITKRQVTLTSATASKVYDGTALTNNTVTVGGDGWATGEGATYNVTGSQTNVGSSNNTFTYALNQNTLSDNYDITKTEGTLTVTALDDEVVVTITENSGTELYDGTAKTVTGYTVTSISNTLYTAADFSFSGADSVSGTNAGTYNMELVPADFTNNNTNFTNVTFVIVDGTLEITKRQVTLTSATASKVYDGTALTNNTVTVGGDGWATGEGATYNVTGSQTNVGSSNNTFTYALNQNTLSDNYDITKTEGTLTVTALDDEVVVTITENSGTELYDGTAKTVTGYTVTSISNTLYTAADFSFSGADSVSGTNAGTYNMELVPADFTNNNTNFTNVTFVIVDGTLEITKRQVTLTSATASKVYDGTALTNNTVTVGGDGWATGEGATYNVTGSQTNVGSSNNTFTYALNQNTLSDNYDITKTEGTLTVTALDDEVVVTITENSGTELYDGTAKTVTGYTVTSISNTLYTAADFSFSGADSVSGTNAGTYNMELVPADFTNNNTNFTNVTFVIVDGTLEITKRQVTLTSATASKVYDGTALTNNTVTVGGDGWATGEGATYNVTGSQTNVGSSNNTFTYALNQNTLSDNYDITKTEGTLTVTALDDEVVVTITENSGTELYDGTAKTVTGYTVTSISNTLYTAADFSFSGADSVSGTNAGTYNMELVPADFTNNNTNFTNVTFVIVDGTLEITKRQVTLTSATASKVYDGTALTNNTVTVGGDGWATGEGATYNVTGSQTNVGSSNNTFTYALNQNTLSDNYDITKTEGTLTVTALDDEVVVTITENSGTELYDGTAKTVTGYTVTSISNTLYTAADFSFSGTDSVSGTNAGTYNMELVPADFTNNNTNFTNVTFVIVDGTLEITKRQVTLTSATASKVYDGTALTNNTVTVGGDGWATGEGATYNVTGSQTNVGSSNNTFTYALSQNTLSDNYDITKTEGTLTVTALDDEVVVTITENSGTELYDGTAKTVTGYTVTSISNTLYTAADFSFSGTDSVSGTNAGTYNMELVPADFTNNNTNFTNVTFVIVDGTLTITPKAVTITTGSGSKEYDGTALTESTVTIAGLVDGESVTLAATGSQTEVGSSTNTYSITWDNATAANYTVTDNLGTLTVTTSAVEVILTAPSDSKTYDGTALTAITGVTWTGLPTGFTVEATASGSQTDAGSSDNVVDDGYVIKDADGNDKTANFTNVTKVNGTLTVNPKAVTITTGSDSKAYDGTALTNATVGIEGLVDGESVTLVATGSQTEVGSSDNTYSITWDNATAANYTITNNLGTLTITQNPSIALVKEVDKTAVNAAGDVVYTYTITNTGDVPLTELSVTDDKISGKIVSTLTKLDPGASTEVTATYTITQAMMDAGDPIINIATASGLAPDRTTVVTSDKATAAVEISQEPSAKVEKTATEDSFEAVGDELHYTVVITNTGNITLKNIEISDTLVPFDEMTLVGDTNGDGHLDVDETWTLMYTYIVKQDDLDAGKVLNKVSVTKPDNPDEPDLPPTEGEEEVPADQKPSAKVEKTATEDSFEAVGDELHYTVVITNTGNITLKNIEINDTLVPFDEMTLVGDTNGDGHLDVDETWTLTYTYTVTQDDLDAGKVLNKVSVTKPDNPDNPEEPDLPPTEGEEEVPAEQKPSAKVEKTATETNFEVVGDELHYTVVITNTGNITLKNLEITDTLVPFEDMTLTGDANNDGHLDVDETWTLTYTYTVTQDDLDAGKVLNKVSVTKPENPDNPDEPDLPPAEEEHVVPGPAFLDIEAIINPTKSLAGRVLTAGEFTFELRQGDTLLQSTTNDAEGNILFSSLGYTQEDIGQTYSYTIVEVPAMEANMTYSEMAIDFTVLVEDAGDGVLSLTVNAPTDVIFFNVYTAPAPEPIPAPPVLNFDLGVVPSNVADCLE